VFADTPIRRHADTSSFAVAATPRYERCRLGEVALRASLLPIFCYPLFAFPEYQAQEMGIGEAAIVLALAYDDQVH
jgi:hypothetical protein